MIVKRAPFDKMKSFSESHNARKNGVFSTIIEKIFHFHRTKKSKGVNMQKKIIVKNFNLIHNVKNTLKGQKKNFFPENLRVPKKSKGGRMERRFWWTNTASYTS